MSYQQKSNIISLISTIFVSVPYFIYVFYRFSTSKLNSADELGFWASAILILIPIRILTEIVMHIKFAILNAIITQKAEEMDTLVDERDKMIELKAKRNTLFAFMIGFFAAMVVALIYKTPTAMFVIIFISCFKAELVGIISSIYYYRKG